MFDEHKHSWCSKCRRFYPIGEWPFCPHGVPEEHHPFKPYFDLSLGQKVTSNSQRNRVAKSMNADMRDQPSRGDTSARQDRCNEMRKAQGRST